jgi:elongation factor G
MKNFAAKDIRNVTFVGHGGSGKTTLAEAMLYLSGMTDRLGKVSDGTTVLDYDPEEKKRIASIQTAIAPVIWKDKKINIIDTPGLFDFEGGVAEGMRVGDTAVIVLSGKSGLTVGAEKGFAAAKGKGRVFFISKLNSDSADFYKVFNSIKDKYGSSVVAAVIPYVVDRKVECLVNLLEDKAYKYTDGKAAEVDMPSIPEYDDYKSALMEAIASSDDELMEKFFEGESFTKEEIVKGLKEGIETGAIYPVFCGSGKTMCGVDIFMDALADYAVPADAYKEIAVDADGKESEVAVDENGNPLAIVFKTIIDPFVGKLSYFKVVQGKISTESKIINSSTGEPERISKVYIIKGGKQEEAKFIGAGDIGACPKLMTVNTGDSLTTLSNKIALKGIDFPKPTLSMAVLSTVKGEEEKIAQGIIRLLEEDKTISFKHNHETHQQILSGLGEQHLDVIISKVKQKFGVSPQLETPKVAYRETITKKVQVQGKHKKQSGGSGQYGDVWIEFEPCDADGLEFGERVVGGSVPKNFFPAVEKGLLDSMKKGVLAGYPMVGVKATLYDGSYHPVDSNEMAFKMAAALAYKNGIPQAKPVILEPIGSLKIVVDDGSMGDVIGEINKRRGRMLGMNQESNGMSEIDAEVPMAELGDFATYLRSVTGGRGSFTLDFNRYEAAPPMVTEKVIANSNLKDE